jgi:Sec-independent protein translocase protein TatA
MNIVGMGPLEILVVLLLAFILLGPQKMMEGAKLFGKASREIRRMTDELQTTINLEEEPDYSKKPNTSVEVGSDASQDTGEERDQDEETPGDDGPISFKQESVNPKADKGDKN